MQLLSYFVHKCKFFKTCDNGIKRVTDVNPGSYSKRSLLIVKQQSFKKEIMGFMVRKHFETRLHCIWPGLYKKEVE